MRYDITFFFNYVYFNAVHILMSYLLDINLGSYIMIDLIQ